MGVRPISGVRLKAVIGAELVAVNAAIGLRVSEIGGVDAHLHRRAIGIGQSSEREQRVAGRLRLHGAGIEVELRHPFQRVVRGEVEPEIVRMRGPGASATVSEERVVADFGAQSIRAHHSGIHGRLAVAPVRDDIHQVEPGAPLAGGDDEAIQGLVPGINRFIHLVECVSALGASVIRRGRPRPSVPGGVSGADVKLHHGLVRLGWQDRPEITIARDAITVRAVVEHRCGSKTRRAVHAAEKLHRHAGDGFIQDLRGNCDGIRRMGNGRDVLNVEDHRRNVVCGDGIRAPRCSARNQTGPPILPMFVRQCRVDQLDRLAASVRFIGPPPTAPPRRLARIDLAQAQQRPVAIAGVGDGVSDLAKVVREFDFFASV